MLSETMLRNVASLARATSALRPKLTSLLAPITTLQSPPPPAVHAGVPMRAYSNKFDERAHALEVRASAVDCMCVGEVCC